MKLWVDDERQKPDNYDLWATTVDEAISYLQTGQITEISLDHDLGGNRKGTEITNWIRGMAYKGKLGRIIWHVHSQNPVGRDNMSFDMKEADRYWKR